MYGSKEKNTKWALVTGATRGLGHGVVLALLEKGFQVLGCGRSEPEPLPEEFSGRCHWFFLDVRDEDRGPEVLREALSAAGVKPSLEAVVLNAGILGGIKDLRDFSLDELREVMQVNLWANKWILDTLFEQCAEIGQVVAISSGASVSGLRGWGGYGLSKAALNMLMKLYAAERESTHFCSFAPGLVASRMQDEIASMPDDERFPTIERLKAARGTPDMPDARTAGKNVVEAFDKLLQCPSGSFQDIRKLDF